MSKIDGIIDGILIAVAICVAVALVVLVDDTPSCRFKFGDVVRVKSGFYEGVKGEVVRVASDLPSIERARGKLYNIKPVGGRYVFKGLQPQIDVYDDELEPWIALTHTHRIIGPNGSGITIETDDEADSASKQWWIESVHVPKEEPETHWVIWPNGTVTTFEEYCRKFDIVPKGYGDIKTGFLSVVSPTKPTKDDWPFGDWPESQEEPK
jgi:hypothetical protein